MAVQCLSVGVVGVHHANELISEKEVGMVVNISKHGDPLAIIDLAEEKMRRLPRQAVGGDHSSGDPLDWLRASVPGEPGQDYPILNAIQVSLIMIKNFTI